MTASVSPCLCLTAELLGHSSPPCAPATMMLVGAKQTKSPGTVNKGNPPSFMLFLPSITDMESNWYP